MSDNIDKGKRWREEVTRHLGTIRIGILCMTSDNIKSPWLNFEAGALSRLVENDSRVIPYLLALSPTDYPDPLAMFQSTTANKMGTRDLVRAINSAMDVPVPDARLDATFSALWPALETKLDEARRSRHAASPPRRTEREMLKEILIRIRALDRPTRLGAVGLSFRDPPKPFTDLVSDGSLDEVILEHLVDEDEGESTPSDR
jgi:hypothetical protein